MWSATACVHARLSVVVRTASPDGHELARLHQVAALGVEALDVVVVEADARLEAVLERAGRASPVESTLWMPWLTNVRWFGPT